MAAGIPTLLRLFSSTLIRGAANLPLARLGASPLITGASNLRTAQIHHRLVVRFLAVCPSWRSALPSEPQFPWLMIPYNPHKDENPNDDSIRLFYDLSQSKMHKIHLPETRHMMCCATSKGWLLLVAEEGKEVLLLNPLTRAKITLPNFTTPVNILGLEGATYEANYWFSLLGNFVINKVIFSSDPREPGCIIMVFLQKACRIFFCRVGDPCWTLVNQDPEEIQIEKPSDGTLYDDKFYLLAHDRVLRVYDLNDPDMNFYCPFLPAFLYKSFFLEGKSGVNLVVTNGSRKKQEESGLEDLEKKRALDVYRLDLGVIRPAMWRREMTKTSIFAGDINDHYLAVRSDVCDALKRGYLYKPGFYEPPQGDHVFYGIWGASLEDGIGDLIVGDLGQRPDLWPAAPCLWFQPSLV